MRSGLLGLGVAAVLVDQLYLGSVYRLTDVQRFEVVVCELIVLGVLITLAAADTARPRAMVAVLACGLAAVHIALASAVAAR